MLLTSSQSVGIKLKMDKQIDKDKIQALIKENKDIVAVIDRLKTSLPNYLFGVVGEEALVNLYLGLPLKNIDVFLCEVGEMNAEDSDLLGKMQEKYKIEKREFIAKRYVNKVLDSVTRVVGVEIDFEEKVKGDINAAEPSVTVHWLWSEFLARDGFEISVDGVKKMLTESSGELSCKSIYCDTDYNIYGEALNDFTVSHLKFEDLLISKPKYIDEVWTYINKGILVDKEFAKNIAAHYRRTGSLGALAIAVAMKLIDQEKVSEFIANNRFKPIDIVEYRKWAKTKLKFG